jgi:hypothetical protein
VKKKMISLWKEQGKPGEGDWARTRRGTVRCLCPHPLLHHCQYVPLDYASGSVSGAKPRVAFHLREKKEGRGNDVRPTCQRQ